MLAEPLYYGPWQIVYKVKHCLCSDGRRRTVRTNGIADTYFSMPARVKVKGKTVTGYITGFENEQGEADMRFHAYTYRKNHYLLP